MAAPVTSTGASLLLLPKPSLSSTTSQPPLLFFTHRPPLPVLRSHYSFSPVSSRFTTVRCCANRSAGDNFLPLSSVSKFRDPPCFDEESWLVVMDKPGGEGATEEQMVDCYVQTLAQVVGSEDKALKKIYRVACEGKLGFGCVMDDDETFHKLRGLPGVLDVLPDPYVPPYKDSADTLKHFAFNIRRFVRHQEIVAEQGKDGVKYGRSLARWFKLVPDLLMEQVEEDIHSISAAFKALDMGIYSTMQSPVEQVLSELSVHVKELGRINRATEEGEDKENETEKAMVLEQVKKAIESLFLAVEVVDSFHSDKGNVIGLLTQALSGLSERVVDLWNLTTQEADGTAHGDAKQEEEARLEDSIDGLSSQEENSGPSLSS